MEGRAAPRPFPVQSRGPCGFSGGCHSPAGRCLSRDRPGRVDGGLGHLSEEHRGGEAPRDSSPAQALVSSGRPSPTPAPSTPWVSRGAETGQGASLSPPRPLPAGSKGRLAGAEPGDPRPPAPHPAPQRSSQWPSLCSLAALARGDHPHFFRPTAPLALRLAHSTPTVDTRGGAIRHFCATYITPEGAWPARPPPPF